MTPEAVAEEVNKASLLGRGGAGFPAGRKWSMLRKAETTYLVINGDESEPATFKDHLLIERDPHQIIEGTIIAAYAIGASAGLHLLPRRVRARSRAADRGLQRGVRTRRARRARSSARTFSLDLVIHPGAGAYICGEETALLESLEGKRGFPRIKPPYFPAAIGLYGEPTVVNNVETMSNLPWIVEQRWRGLRGARRRQLDGHATVRALRAGRSAPAGTSSRCRRRRSATSSSTRASAAGSTTDGAEGDHPRRGLGAVVRSGAPRPRPRSRRGRQGRLDARLGLDRRHGRDDLRGARRVADHAVLPPRVLRAVHAVPRGRGLAGEDPAAHRGRARAARRTSTC